MVSEDDIRKVLGLNTPVFQYAHLKTYGNVLDLLPTDRSCAVILTSFETRQSGHWCILSRYGNIIEWFDSYGGKPDSELSYISQAKQKEMGEFGHDLERLLDNVHPFFHVIFNRRRFQQLHDGINTCGRWCCLRGVKMKQGLNLKEFQLLIDKETKKRKVTPDQLVVLKMPL